ncbi:MAG: hypothetical protein HKN70_10230 [Gammaproteobacteria bacterium]|nr:hypothetical protein [Gammaproteobacteria bacterium]
MDRKTGDEVMVTGVCHAIKTLIARVFVAATVYLLTLSMVNADGGFVSLQLGQGDIDIDRTALLPFTPTGTSDDNAIAFVASGGYQFSSGIYIDLAFTSLDTVTIFGLNDVFSLSTTKLGVGYKLKTNESFSFIGKIGISFWDLDLREGFAFNPGPEEGGGFDGTDPFFEFGGEFKVSKRVGLILTHSRESYDIGGSTATRFGVEYFFGSD